MLTTVFWRSTRPPMHESTLASSSMATIELKTPAAAPPYRSGISMLISFYYCQHVLLFLIATSQISSFCTTHTSKSVEEECVFTPLSKHSLSMSGRMSPRRSISFTHGSILSRANRLTSSSFNSNRTTISISFSGL